MNCNENIAEEKIIDFILGKMEEDERNYLSSHINDCKSCATLYVSWKHLTDETEAERPVPTMEMKRRLLAAITNEPKPKKAALSKQKWLVLASGIAMACLFSFLILNQSAKHNNIAEIEPFLLDEETIIYEIVPVVNHQMKGYAWINTQSNEMLLFIDGMKPMTLEDYQAWIQTQYELKNAGILTLNGQKGQLYFQDGIVNQLEKIMISKEPKGGSGAPTDPNAVILQLQSR